MNARSLPCPDLSPSWLLAAMLLFLSVTLSAQPTSRPRGDDDHGIREEGSPSAFGAGMRSVGMSFIENRGQIVDAEGGGRPDILYTAGSGPVRMYLRRGAISYVFAQADLESAGSDGRGHLRLGHDPDSRRRGAVEPLSGTVTTYRMDVEFVGANRDARVTSEDRTFYHTNYYLPHCPGGITDVGSYRRVVYHDIYPKIDLVFHGDGRGIKYDFVVHAGGDPRAIVMRYIGADDLSATDEGGVRARNMLGVLTEGKPVSWQASGGVRCAYAVEGDEVRFDLGEYDRREDLVIDPLLQWATYAGGSGADSWTAGGVGTWQQLPFGRILAADTSGNIAMVGSTTSIDFPILAATPFQATLHGDYDGFILKLDGDGQPLWSTYIGGSDEDDIRDIVFDPVTTSFDIGGNTVSANFPVTPGAMQGTYGGLAFYWGDCFIAQFDSNGVRRWSTFFGGPAGEISGGIDVDDAGNIVLIGQGMNPGLALPDPFPGTGHTMFVLKMTSAGSRIWATMYGGGDGGEESYGVSIDGSNDIIIVGCTPSSSLPFSANTFQPTLGGGLDGFVAKFTAGGQCLWSTYVGGGGLDVLASVDCDSQGDIIVCGKTSSSDFPTTPSGFQPAYAGGLADGFVMKLTTNGTRVWGTYYGGTTVVPSATDGDGARMVAVAPDDDIMISGSTQSTDFPVTADAFQSTLQAWSSPFLLRFRPDGTRIWGTYYSSTAGLAIESGMGLAADDFGGVYIAGLTRFSQNTLPSASLGFQPTDAGGFSDMYLAKFTGFCTLVPPMPPIVNICGDAPSVTLHGPAGFRTYRWDPGDATTQDLTVSEAGTYTLTTRSRNGCIGSATVEVRRAPKPHPVIIATPSLDLCDGDSLRLDATTRGVISYTWSTGETSPSIWTKRAGQYTVRVIDTNGCSDTAFAVTVRVFPRPDKPVLPAGPIRICPDSLLVLTAGGSFAGYLWSTGATTPSITVSSPGRYWVSGVNQFGCARRSDTVTVLFNARPTPVIVVHGTGIACQGESVDLEVSGGVFSRIRWSSGEQTAVIKASKPGVYSVQVWSQEGCRGGPDTATVTILPGPLASISGPEVICVNATAVYRTVEGFAQLYRWRLEGDGAIVGPTDQSSLRVKWGGEGSGKLRLEVTDTRTGCTTVVEREVRIGTELKPVIVALGPTSFCQGDSVLLDAGSTMKSYRWSTGDTTEYVMVKAAGSYSVSVEDSGGCKGSSSPIIVQVVPRPSPVIEGARKVCLNGTASYSAADAAGHEYSWFVNGGIILSGQGTSQISVQWGAGPTGTVDLAESAAQGLCQGKASQLSVEIGAELEPVIVALGATSFCRGDSVVLDAGDGYARYLWSSGQSTRRITVRESGSYSVSVGDAGGCSGTSRPVTVVVSPPADPVVRVIGPVAFCSGDSTVLDAGADFARYRWSSGETTQMIVVRTSGSYSVEVTTGGGCTASSPAVSIVVEEGPTPEISGAVKVCQGSTVVYSTASVAGHRYAWSTGGGTVVSGQGTSQIRVEWGSGPSGIIDLVETNASGRCQTVARRYEVSIGTELEPVIEPGGHVDLCAGDSVELDGGDGYARYEWTTGETSRRIMVMSSGEYGVKVWDAGGCSGSSRAVEVEVHAAPVVAITPGGPVRITAGDSVVLDAGSGYASYLWSSGETTRTITVKEKGQYSVAVVDGYGCRGEAGPVDVEVTTPVGPGSGHTVVALPSVEGVPGEIVRVALMLSESRDLPSVPLEFTARLRFRASLLSPAGGAPPGRIEGLDRVLDVQGMLAPGSSSGVLKEVELLALLGDSEVIPLHLESVRWSDTTIVTELRDGQFTLKGLCVAGPTRLVGESGRFALKGIRPNPVGDRAEIEYELNESGRVRLEIIDMLGRRVMVLGDLDGAPGLYVMTVDVTGLPSGRYIVALQTPTRRQTTPMQIWR